MSLIKNERDALKEQNREAQQKKNFKFTNINTQNSQMNKMITAGKVCAFYIFKTGFSFASLKNNSN